MPESITSEGAEALASEWLASGWLQDPSALTQIVFGAVLLLFGRRLFWLLVGVVGFGIGLLLAETYLSVEGETMRWIIGIGAGLAAALAAVFLQKVALGIAGALVGGYSVYWYLALGGEELAGWQWAVVVVAAAIGFVVARPVFDFGLVLLSSLAGATLLTENVVLEAGPSRWVFAGLVVVGAVVQTLSLGRRRKRDG